jgi:hypothetical protein
MSSEGQSRARTTLESRVDNGPCGVTGPVSRETRQMRVVSSPGGSISLMRTGSSSPRSRPGPWRRRPRQSASRGRIRGRRPTAPPLPTRPCWWPGTSRGPSRALGEVPRPDHDGLTFGLQLPGDPLRSGPVATGVGDEEVRRPTHRPHPAHQCVVRGLPQRDEPGTRPAHLSRSHRTSKAIEKRRSDHRTYQRGTKANP